MNTPTMRALWLASGQLELRDVPRPRRDDEAIVDVTLGGICGTDLGLTRGYYPYDGILGHEFVGRVTRAPAADWVGARVVGEINATCGGRCATCRAGRDTHCERRTVLGIVGRDGAFAQQLALPEMCLHRVPDHVTDEQAVFVEPLAAALEIQQQVQVRPLDRVLVVGAGRLGQLIAWTLALTGCDLTVVARHAWQRRLLEARGIRAVDEETPLAGFDTVVEATGSTDGFTAARAAIRPRGTLVLKSTYPGELSLDMSSVVVDELTLVGSRCGPFAPALRLLASGAVDPRPLIHDCHPLSQALHAFDVASRAGTGKVLLDCTQ